MVKKSADTVENTEIIQPVLDKVKISDIVNKKPIGYKMKIGSITRDITSKKKNRYRQTYKKRRPYKRTRKYYRRKYSRY